MSRSRRTILLALATLAVGAGAWFGRGALEAARFEALVAHLREAGALPPFARWDARSVPPGGNGYRNLLQAHEAYASIRSDATNWKPRVEGWTPYGRDERPLAERPPDQQAAERAFLAKLDSVLADIDRALGFEVIVSEQEAPASSDAMLEVTFALDILRRFGAVDPDDEWRCIERMLGLLDRWRTTPAAVTPRAYIVNRRALAPLRRFLSTERRWVVSRRPWSRWSRILEDEERRLLELLSWRAPYEHACAVWLLEHWSRGVDPMGTFDEGPLVTDPAAWLADLPVAADVRPRGRHWWSRPLVHAFAHETADAIPDEPPGPLTLEAIRRVVLEGGAEADVAYTRVLDTILTLRLARAALLATQGANRRGPGEADLDALERRASAAGLLDPCSEAPLVFSRTAQGTIEIQPPPSDVLQRVREAETYLEHDWTWKVPR